MDRFSNHLLTIIKRIDFNSYCICLGRLHHFEANLKDERVNEWRLWYGDPCFKKEFCGTFKSLKDGFFLFYIEKTLASI